MIKLIGIYKIINNINGKIYIGQSINISKRIYEHKYKAFCKEDISYNSAIHSSLRKYGIENFTFEIIEECLIEELDEKEKYYIEYFNTISPNGYNILEGGQKFRAKGNFCIDCGKSIYKNAKRCIKCSQEAQRKVLRPEPLELAKLIKEYGFRGTGKIFNVSDRAIAHWCFCYNIPKTKKELIEWYNNQMNINKIENNKKLFKKVAQIDPKTNEILNIFNNASEAAKYLKKSNSHIIEVCNYKNKTAYGFIWRYINENGELV